MSKPIATFPSLKLQVNNKVNILQRYSIHENPNMKASLQDSLSPDISTGASTSSSHPRNDHESGYAPYENITTNNSLMNLDMILTRMVMAEALGTFMLVFCISGIIGNLQFMGIESGLMEYATTAGLSVAVIVFSIGSISGAHVNPAVTIAFATLGPFPWYKVPFYIVAQVGGSVLATYAGRFVYGLKAEAMLTRPLHGPTSAFCVELIATFIILFLTTSLFHQRKTLQQLAGLIAGVAICLGVLISGPVSGGSMNPARSIGPALVSWRFEHVWIYMVAPTAGAVLGVFMFRVLRLEGWSCKSDHHPNSS